MTFDHCMTGMRDRGIRALVRFYRVEGNRMRTRILWDGVNGELYWVRLSNKLMRRVRFYQRRPHLARQFYPRKFRQ